MNILKETGFDPSIIIGKAYEHNNVHGLYSAITALLNLRTTLSSQANSTELKPEVLAVEHTIGQLAVHLGEWSGIGDVAGKLLMMGAVCSRGDVLRYAAPIYDQMDSKELISKIPLMGIVGRISSGKGTVGEIIKNLTGSYHLPLSDRLREYAVALGQFPPFSRNTLRDINDELKPRFGKQIFVDWTMNLAKQLATRYQFPLITIDGFRSLEESQHFIDNGGILIGITSRDEIRYNRLLQRNRDGDDFNWELFSKSDSIERVWIDPIFELIPKENVISNDGDIDDLTSQTRQLLSRNGVL